MLTIHHLNKSFGITTVLRDISFSANQHEKIGLLGPNGCGKTTLLRMIAGVDRPDSGSIQFTPGDTRVGYLPQGFKFAEDQTIQSFLNEGLLDTQTLAGQFEEVSTQLGHFPDDPDLHDQFDRLLGQLNEASSADVQVKPVLSALNLAHLSPDTPVGILSGGQKTRLGLAKLLLSNPDLLLLDEPTNHLDLEMLEWLENWLIAFPSTAIIVSHDRIFLDRVVTSIYEIAPRTHRGKMYAGNYSAYAEQKADEWEQHWQEYTDQQDEIFHLRQTANHLRGLAQFKKGGKADSGDKFAKGFFANRGLETMGRAKQIERRLERLVTDEKIDKPKPEWEMKMEFSAPPESSRTVLSLEECVIGYGGNILLEDINLTVPLWAADCHGGRKRIGKIFFDQDDYGTGAHIIRRNSHWRQCKNRIYGTGTGYSGSKLKPLPGHDAAGGFFRNRGTSLPFAIPVQR